MSLRRVFRYVIGVIVALVLFALVLPLLGIPKSKFLPPAAVYATAKGEAIGVLTGKYYEETGNPFRIGTHLHFVNYVFRAHMPPPRGSAVPGPWTKYTGTIHVDQGTYNEIRPTDQQMQGGSSSEIHAGTVIPATPGQKVRIRYEVTYPDINGIDAPWGGRNVGPGSNLLSGWLLFVVLGLILGYFFMLLFENFGVREEI